MNGRMISHLKIANKTEEMLKEMPDYIYEWYNKLKSNKSATTCLEYIYKIRKMLLYINHEDIKNIKIDDLKYNSIVGYYNSLMYKDTNKGKIEYSDSYRVTVWVCLNNFFDFMCSRHYMDENPMNDIGRPKNNDLDRILEEQIPVTIKDFKKLLKAVDNCKIKGKGIRERDKLILILLMHTGMRESALLNMNIDNIDFEKKQLVVIDKGDKFQKYPLNEMIINVINDWLLIREEFAKKAVKDEDKEALFLSNQGKRLAVRSLQKLLDKYSNIGLNRKISPHKIRAGYITTIIDKTKNPEIARRAAGHRSFETTKRYYRTNNNEREVAANLISSLL